MKVLHIITGLNDGGAEAVLFRLVTHDTQNQHTVVSLTDAGKYGPMLRERGIEVFPLDMPRGRLTLQGLYSLWRTLRRLHPDVVQTWMYHADLVGGIAARMAGIPVVWGIRHTTLEPGQSSRATIWVARACARLSRRVPVRIVACAQAAQAVHATLGYDAQRMVVIPNGYDLAHFTPDTAARHRLRAEWNVADDLPLIGMVARWDPQKDHQNLVAAMGLLANRGVGFRALLVGTGVTNAQPELQATLTGHGLGKRVRLLGPRSDIPAVMLALDVHVLSSSYGEAFPNVLAEAMTCERPCVVTDVGDSARIVGSSGEVVPPRNPEVLAAGLVRLLDRLGHEPDLGHRARQRVVAEFSVERMLERTEQVLLGGL